MSDSELTGWLLVVFGLYCLAAALGEHLRPGQWKKMVEELNDSAALSFLAGIVTLAIGTAISLAHPCQIGESWRAATVNILGYAMVLEGLTFFAFPRSLSHFAASLMSAANPLWVVIAAIFGIVFLVFGIPLVS